jgi:hypothetical protein
MLAVVLMQVVPMWAEESRQVESWAVVLVQAEVLTQLVGFLVQPLMQVEEFQSAVPEWVTRESLLVMAAVVDPRVPCTRTQGLAWLGAWQGPPSKQILGVELVQDLLTQAAA